jgi:hypothetical protein
MQTIPNAQKKAQKHFAPTWVQLCFFAFLCAFSALHFVQLWECILVL